MKACSLRALLAGLILPVVGCANFAGQAPVNAEPKVATIDVILVTGWHTELVVPTADISGKLSVFKRDFPQARWLAFGWGEQAFFMARHPTSGDALRAIFPAPAALLVTGLTRAPSLGSRLYPVRVTRSGLVALSNYLWSYVATSPSGVPKRLGTGPGPSSVFFASTGHYDLFHTCNTWVAAALQAAGVPVSTVGVIIAGQVIQQLRYLQKHNRRHPADAPAGP